MKKSIPNIIFTSYKPELSENIRVESIYQKWQKINPGMKIKYFSDGDIKKYFNGPGKRWKMEYEMLTNGVAIADFFRVCYIYTHGGIWIDFDVIPFNFSDTYDIAYLNNENLLFDCGWKNISYVMIGGTKGSNLFNQAIKYVCQKIREGAPYDPGQFPGMDVTGPKAFQAMMVSVFDIPAHEGKFEAQNKIITTKCGTPFLYVKKPTGARGLKSSDYNKLLEEYNQKPWRKTLKR